MREAYPSKQVVLVTEKASLMPWDLKPKESAKLLARVQALGVTVQLNGSFAEFDEHSDDESDFVIRCTGGDPNSDFLVRWCAPLLRQVDALLQSPDVLDDSGHVCVSEQHLIQGYDSAFALGDVVSGTHISISMTVKQHAPVVAHNVLVAIGREGGAMQALTPRAESGIVVALGSKDSFSVGVRGFFKAHKKQRDMFVSAHRKRVV